MEKKISLNDLGLFESERLVNTPKSLEACKREGIQPQELLYKSLDSYAEYADSEIKALYYEFFENKRRMLLKELRKTRKKIVWDEKRIGKAGRPRI